MPDTNPRSTAKIGGHPIHPILVLFPVAFLVSTLVTDIVFLTTGVTGWATASVWLVGAGVVTALVAALAGFTDFFGEPRVRQIRDAWRHMIGNLITVALAAASWLMRVNQGAEEAVMPWGVTLSALVSVILLYTGWKGGELAYRYRVGVHDAFPEPPAYAPGEQQKRHERV
ncbi:MAG: DUF2231 domain-containing protein [Hyphomonadaceae bacterium]